MNNYAYATLLGSDDFFIPVYGLFHSLQQTQSKYPLIVMVMDTVSIQTIKKLEHYNIPYKVFPNLQSSAKVVGILQKPDIRTEINHAQFFQIMMMNKFYIFDLKEYDKICYLDGDILIKENIDFIFNYQTPAGKILEYGSIKVKDGEFSVDPPFIAGEHWLINPKDYTSWEIFEKFTPFEWDECVIRQLYPINKFTNTLLTDDTDYIYHAHSHCNMFRYWEYFQLRSVEDVHRFYEQINMIDLENFSVQSGNLKDDLFKDFHDRTVLSVKMSGDEQSDHLDNIKLEDQSYYHKLNQMIKEKVDNDNH